MVAGFRDRSFYRRPAWSTAYERTISAALEAIGVDHVILQQATDELDEGRFGVSWNDGHPSAEASRIIAAEIARTLRRRGH